MRVLHEGKIAEIPKDIEISDVINNGHDTNEMAITKLPMLPKIEQNDYVEIDIYHRSISAITITEGLWGHQALARDKAVREHTTNTYESLEYSHDINIVMESQFYHVFVQRSILMTSQGITR